MPRPLWPPKYVNVSIPVLRDASIPNAAFRFYCKLRALAWGEDKLTLSLEKVQKETGLSRTRVYEYARALRDHHGLLSYDVRNDAFECSFPTLDENPENRDLPSPLVLTPVEPKKQDLKQKQESVKSRKAGIPESGILYPLAAALAEVCRMKLDANRPRIFAEAKLLAKIVPTPTPDQIRQHYNGRRDCFWRSTDWRGKKGDDPTPAAIRQTWGKWEPAALLAVAQADPAQVEQLKAAIAAHKAKQDAIPS